MEGGLPIPGEVSEVCRAARRQSILGRDAIRQARFHLRERGYGLASVVNTGGEIYLGGKALALARAVSTTSVFQNEPQ